MTAPPGAIRSAASKRDLLLSAINVQVEQEHFTAWVLPYTNEDAYDQLRSRPDIFVYRRHREPPEGQVLVIPLQSEPLDGMGEPVSFVSRRQLRVLATLLERRLPIVLPKLELRRCFGGLERVRTSDDLMDQSFHRAQIARPRALALFHKWNRTRFRVQTEFLPGRGPLLAMTVELGQRFSIEGTAADLIDAGFLLDGLGLVKLGEDEDEAWLGRVTGREGDKLVVAGADGEILVDPRTSRVDPSMEVFSTLVPQVLEVGDLRRYEEAEHALLTEQFSGERHLRRLSDVASYFARTGPVQIARGLSVSFGDLISVSFSGHEPSAVQLPPVEYCFSPDGTSTDTIPFRGLEQRGPADSLRFRPKEPKLLIVYPAEARADAERFIHRLVDGMGSEGKERFARGFASTYRLTKVLPQFLPLNLPPVASRKTGEFYVKALADSFDPNNRPDMVFVIVRDEDAWIEYGNPYTASKAYLLGQGIPSQEMRLSKIRSSPGNYQYILEDIAVATYAKMGGSPWTLKPASHDIREIVLGMAYAELGGRFSSKRRFMGITTVFASDGTYLLAAKSPQCRYEEYPAVLAATVKDTLARLVKEYGWGDGKPVRLVFHSVKPLTRNDIATVAKTAVQELGNQARFEAAYLTVVREHPLKVLAPAARGRRAVVEFGSGRFGYSLVGQGVPERGVVVNLGNSRRLVCVHGSVLAAREGAGIPQPLLLKLDGASTYRDMSALAQQVYQFTGLSWGSMKPVSEPVTIHYARLIAKMVARLDGHPQWSDNVLDTHLRNKRWFL